MTRVLVTGMSGTGKSTVLELLARQGYRTVDTDYGDWIDNSAEPQWREDRMDALLTEHERAGAPLFVAGTVWNQQKFYPCFNEIVLLTAPLSIMFDRLACRENNPLGKSSEERARIAADTAEVEPLLRASATLEIDTQKPLPDVVSLLSALVM